MVKFWQSQGISSGNPSVVELQAWSKKVEIEMMNSIRKQIDEENENIKNGIFILKPSR